MNCLKKITVSLLAMTEIILYIINISVFFSKLTIRWQYNILLCIIIDIQQIKLLLYTLKRSHDDSWTCQFESYHVCIIILWTRQSMAIALLWQQLIHTCMVVATVTIAIAILMRLLSWCDHSLNIENVPNYVYLGHRKS